MKNNMTELVSWFQLEYPKLVSHMRQCTHHLTKRDEYNLYINNTKQGSPVLLFDEDQFYKDSSINPYHCEGDVFTHTMMVCKQAENASYEVRIAALLHDIGKPSTRKVNPKNGRVSFFNHDAVSAFMALEILNHPFLELADIQKVRIFNTIALHTQIYKLNEEQLADIGDKDLIKNLIELGRADHGGRFHTKSDSIIPSFESLSFGSQYKNQGMIKKDKEVIVLVGLPASGKSTWWRNHLSGETCQVISRDMIIEDVGKGDNYNEKWKSVDQNKVNEELERLFCFNKTKKGKYTYDKVIVDMTHMSKKSRRRSLSHFDSSYKKKAVVFLTDLQRNKLQNESRSGKVIEQSVIDKMMRSFYPPTLEEFDEIEYVF